MRPILLIKTGATLPSIVPQRGDFEDWFAAGLGLPPEEIAVVQVHRGEELPAPAAVRGVVITGSAAMVSDREPWSEQTAAWLRQAVPVGVPILGVCYGHQLLAHVFGGEVGRNPLGVELGSKEVQLSSAAARDPLFSGLPEAIVLQLSHEESVTRLPGAAIVLARTAQDPHCAFSLGERVWGLQFHPEFDADIIRGYIRARADRLRRGGQDPDALLAESRDSQWGTELLRRFVQLL